MFITTLYEIITTLYYITLCYIVLYYYTYYISYCIVLCFIGLFHIFTIDDSCKPTGTRKNDTLNTDDFSGVRKQVKHIQVESLHVPRSEKTAFLEIWDPYWSRKACS